MKIRPAKAADCSGCQNLIFECKELRNVYGQSDYYEWLLMFIEKGIFFVAEEKKQIVGFIVGEINTGYALNQLMAVSLAHRGKGIGKKLVKAFEEECRKREIYYILLYAHKSRKTFFNECGYQMGAACYEFMKILPEKS